MSAALDKIVTKLSQVLSQEEVATALEETKKSSIWIQNVIKKVSTIYENT